MTQPNEAVKEEHAADVAEETKKMEEFFKSQDPRATIYAKSDAIEAEKRKAEEPPKEEPAKEEPEAEVPVDAPAEPAAEPKEPQGEEEEVIDREEYERRTAKWKVKGKFDGEEMVVPAAELVKITGLEKKAARRLEEANRRERELLERQQYQPPIVPPVASESPLVPQQQSAQLHRLTDAQVRERYNELSLESPFDANVFLRQVEEARNQARFHYERQKAEVSKREFLDTYQISEDSEDWNRINAKEFYERHPDILAARDRGDYYAMYATAHVHLKEEKLAQREAELEERSKKAQEKAEAKKQGQVLRVASKPEVPKAEKPKLETPEEYVRNMAKARRQQFGINRNFKT